MMKKIISVICAAALLAAPLTMNASAAYTANEVKAANDELQAAMSEYYGADTVKGDINGDKAFNSGDARSALLYSAGLSTENIDVSKADLDGDGKVTALDARLFLRISAKLESADIINNPYKLRLFNALSNSIKPNSTGFNRCSYKSTDSITYDNASAVNAFTSQMNALMKAAGENTTIDFGKELTTGSGTYSYTSFLKVYTAAENAYPILDNKATSLLTMNDIASIEYLTNQTYNYERYIYDGRDANNNIKYKLDETNSKAIPGLDCLVVRFNNEKVTDLDADPLTFSHGKIFDLPDSEQMTDSYKELNDTMTELKDMGTLSATFRDLVYNGSYVKIFYNKDTGAVCGTEYYMHYDFTVALYMDINMGVETLFGTIGMVIKDQTINITDKETTKTQYYFPENVK